MYEFDNDFYFLSTGTYIESFISNLFLIQNSKHILNCQDET